MRMLRVGLIAAALSAALSFGAQAQQAPWTRQGSTLSISASSTSAHAALSPTYAPTAWVCNTGATLAYVGFGDSTYAATTADTPIPAGLCGNLSPNGATYIAAITASSTTTVLATPGGGSLLGAGGGGSGSGGGGAVTAADGALVTEGTTTDAACATDNGTCTIEAVLKRATQRLTSILTALGSPFQAGGSIGNTGFAVTGPLGASVASPTTPVSVVEPDDFAVSGSVTSAATLFSQDMLGYESVSVEIIANASANTITFETSDDNTNWVVTTGIGTTYVGGTSPVSVVNLTAPTGYIFPKKLRYFRARVSTFIAGTTTVVGNLHKAPSNNGPVPIGVIAGTANIGGVVPVPSSTSAQAVSHASTTALGTSLVAKNAAGNLYAFNVSGVAGGAAGFAIAYNGSSAPGTGALTGANVLDFCFFDTTARGCSLSRIPMGVQYSAGIVILVSSAASPYTYTTGTDTAAITADYQ